MFQKRVSLCLVMVLTCQSVFARESSKEPSFDVPMIDVTGSSETTAARSEVLKQTFSYDYAQDGDGEPLTNRAAWRVQWDGFVGKDNYLVLDAKLRVFNEEDSQHDSDSAVDYDANINALYLQRSAAQQSLSFGYQTIGLGVMDTLAYLDVLNPWDYSEQAFTAPEDARVGQALLKWSWYGAWQWDMILNLYPTENRYPLTSLKDSFTVFAGTTNFIINEQSPDAFDEPEYLFRLRKSTGKHELQWLLASLLQNDPAIKNSSLSGSTRIFTTHYPRYALIGGSYSHTSGNHQWRMELAYSEDLQPLDAYGYKLNETAAGIGWEYNASGDYTVSVEAGRRWRHIVNDDGVNSHLVNEEVDQTGLRWNKTFLHETVNISLFIGRFDPGPVDMYSLSIRYTPVDEWIIDLYGNHIDTGTTTTIFTSSAGLRLAYHW